jgi:hypothetical protein
MIIGLTAIRNTGDQLMYIACVFYNSSGKKVDIVCIFNYAALRIYNQTSAII